MSIAVNVPGIGIVNFPDGTPEDKIFAEVSKLQAQAPPEAPLTRERPAPGGAPAPRGGEGWEGHAPGTIPEHPLATLGKPFQAAGQWALDPENLPTLGGMAGGLVGTAIPIPGVGTTAGVLAGGALGAGLGGFLGAGGRALAREAEGATAPTAGELAADMGGQAALQGGSQAVGGALMKGVGVAGRGLMNVALRPGSKLALEFPNLARTAIREGVNVSPAGLEKAVGLRNAYSAEVDDIVAAANAGAPPVRAPEVMGAFKPSFTAAREQIDAALPQGQGALADVAARARATAQSFGGTPAVPGTPAMPGGIDLMTAHTRKGTLQDAASAAYKQQAAGQPINSIDAGLNKNLAKAYQTAVESRAPAVIPGNQRTQELIGLQRAIQQRAGSSGMSQYLLPTVAGVATGYGSFQAGADPVKAAGIGAVGAAAMNPAVLGRGALMLGRAGLSNGQIPANIMRGLASLVSNQPEYVPPQRRGAARPGIDAERVRRLSQ
jgi:hypothetical protein